MKEIDKIIEKKQQAERIERLAFDIQQLKIDAEKIEITSTIDKAILRVNDYEGRSNSVHVQFYASELKEILASKIKSSEERLNKLIEEF